MAFSSSQNAESSTNLKYIMASVLCGVNQKKSSTVQFNVYMDMVALAKPSAGFTCCLLCTVGERTLRSIYYSGPLFVTIYECC